MLIFLLLCHYVADYCLTTPTMIRAKADGRSLMPIMMHAAVHAVLMGIVMLAFGVEIGRAGCWAAVQLLSHFAIDTAKGRVSSRFPLLADVTKKPFWMLNGFDQLLHILIVVAIWSSVT